MKRIEVRSINSDIRAIGVTPGSAGTVTLSVEDADSGVDGDRPLIGGQLTRDDAIGLARLLLEAVGVPFDHIKAVRNDNLCACGQARLGQCSIC